MPTTTTSATARAKPSSWAPISTCCRPRSASGCATAPSSTGCACEHASRRRVGSRFVTPQPYEVRSVAAPLGADDPFAVAPFADGHAAAAGAAALGLDRNAGAAARLVDDDSRPPRSDINIGLRQLNRTGPAV